MSRPTITGPIYLSGPIAHRDPAREAELRAAFAPAAAELRRCGYEVFDPVEHTQQLWRQFGGTEETFARAVERDFHGERTVRDCYLTHDIRRLVDCAAIVLLPGWPSSRGATLEALVARQTGKALYIWSSNPTPDLRLARFKPTLASLARLHAETENLAEPITTTAPAQLAAVTILAEADRLVATDRQADYGHPLDNFTNIAVLWNAYTTAIKRDRLEPEDVAHMMVLLKLAREAHKPKRDNRVDGAGYFKVADLIHEERARRATKI